MTTAEWSERMSEVPDEDFQEPQRLSVGRAWWIKDADASCPVLGEGLGCAINRTLSLPDHETARTGQARHPIQMVRLGRTRIGRGED